MVQHEFKEYVRQRRMYYARRAPLAGIDLLEPASCADGESVDQSKYRLTRPGSDRVFQWVYTRRP